MLDASLDDLVVDVFDGPHATPKRVATGPYFLGISSLNAGRLDLDKSDHVSEDDFAKWTRRVTPQAGDIVFSYETRIGEAALIPEGLRCCLGRRMGLLRPDLTRVIPEYLLYVWLGPEFQHTLRARTVHGSTVDRILLTEIRSFPIRIHESLDTQRAVVEALRTLDDKIELNRQMNETLEAMARALFKSWFVDFDPVRAKQEGRAPYGMDAETAALFPDAFEGSELGPIPKGWRLNVIDSLISDGVLEVGDGYRAKRSELAVEGLPFARAGNINNGFRFDGAEVLGWPGVERAGRKLSEPGDVVFTSKGTVGRFAFVASDTPRFAYSPQLCFWRALAPERLSPRYLLMWMKGPQFLRQVGMVKGQTDMADYVSLRDQRRMVMLVPPTDVQGAFDRLTRPLLDRLAANTAESETLAELRDTLLPKLISGELRIPDAEALAEAAL